MSLYDKQRHRRAEAIAPYLEAGEPVRASFLGQTPIPPWGFFLIAPYVFIFLQKYRTVAVTDRSVYVMHNAFLRTYRFKAVAHRAPLGSARIEFGSTWMRVDGGPKLHAPPFGPLRRGLTELRAVVEGSRAALPHGEARVPG